MNSSLYDAYGRPVDRALLTEPQAEPTMVGMRNIYSVMHPSAGLTPERLTAILRTAEFGAPELYLELAEEMEEKDLHYLAVLSTRKESVAQLDPIVRPASQAKEDVRNADFVRTVLRTGTLDFAGALFDILDAVGKGFSATEIRWNQEGREWTPAELIWRDPRWFLFDWVSGNELLVRSLSGEAYIGEDESRDDAAAERPMHFSPDNTMRAFGIQPLTARLHPFRFIVHVSKAKSGLPIRGGLARAAGWSYLFKNYLLKDWMIFAEVYGQPLRVGKYHPGATTEDRRELLKAIASIGVDAGAVIPESMAIQFVEARGDRDSAVYHEFCEYLDSSVSKAVLGQTLTTELPRAGGSRAAAQVHEMVRRDILASDARRLAATLTRDLVKPLIDLNYGAPANGYPQLALGLPDDIDDKVFADIIAELADRGLRVRQRTVLDRLGLDEAGPNDPVLHPATTRGKN